MNQEANNEIDLMLWKLGRQSSNLPAEVEPGAAEEHLDADGLNMYAENSLPAKARARYTEHLADCSRCRQIVSQLTMAAGVVVQENKVEVPAPSGIKALLAGFFSPMVLRYAVPTLALVIITSVAFIVFKDSGSRQSGTEVHNAQTAVAKNEAAPGMAGTEGLTNKPEATYAVKGSPSPIQREETTRTKAGETDASKETAANKRDESQTPVDQVAAAPPASVSGNVSQPAPKPAVADDKAPAGAGRDVAEKKRQAEEPSSAEAQIAEAASKSEAKAKAEEQKKIAVSEAARSRPSKAKSLPAAGAQQEREAQNSIASGRRADKDESETRSVAGRKFRREGSTWIDTAYSSQATTNVSRGSEQYRALIADEPSIRTIADQLAGEVIVVWKSRAYKIR